MRIVAVMALVVTTAMLSATKAASIDVLFQEFGLFGTWALDCGKAAAPANPHVSITTPNAGTVLEDHDLGPNYTVNRYSILSAERIGADQLAVEAIFQPGAENEEREMLVFQVRDRTRRTLFNQPDGGAVRVKNGIALAHGNRTPVLHKCE